MDDKIEIETIEDGDIYCPECNGCGYIGCCGIRSFLEEHVKGKTNCTEEDGFIAEIIAYVEADNTEIHDKNIRG